MLEVTLVLVVGLLVVVDLVLLVTLVVVVGLEVVVTLVVVDGFVVELVGLVEVDSPMLVLVTLEMMMVPCLFSSFSVLTGAPNPPCLFSSLVVLIGLPKPP